MTHQIIITILFFIGFIAILLINEYLYRRFHFNSEFSRKSAHILATLSSLLFIVTFNSHWYVLILGVSFFLILYVGKKRNTFKSIYSVERKTMGSYILPISIYLLFFFSKKNDNDLLFILPILILGISDPLAGLFGTYYKSNTTKIKIFNTVLNKTVLGSSIFFFSSFIISIITLYLFNYSINNTLMFSVLISLVVTIVEMFSSKGIDNISVPLSTLVMLLLIA